MTGSLFIDTKSSARRVERRLQYRGLVRGVRFVNPFGTEFDLDASS